MFEVKKTDIVLTTCQKFENEYVEEWVEHNLNVIGFDKIIILDNEDPEHLGEIDQLPILKKEVKAERLLIKPFGLKYPVPRWNTYIYNLIKDKCGWVIFHDIDEYLDVAPFKNVHEFIDDFLKTWPNAVEIAFPWLVYGDNGHYYKENKPVLERFTKPADIKFQVWPDRPDKSQIGFIEKKIMVKGGLNNFNFFHPHKCSYSTEGLGMYYKFLSNKTPYPYFTPFSPQYSNAPHLNHYRTKSIEEYVIRVNHGRGDCDRFWPYEYFFNYNPRTPDRVKVLNEMIEKYKMPNQELRNDSPL